MLEFAAVLWSSFFSELVERKSVREPGVAVLVATDRDGDAR